MDFYRELISYNTGYKLSEFPNTIAQGELISIKSFKELELSYYKGYQQSEFKCIIRKFVRYPILIYEFIAEETGSLNIESFSYSKFLYAI